MARDKTIKIYRRIGGAAGAPGSLIEGEPAYNDNGANGNVNGDLYIGNGAAVRTLVSATRQLEMTGAQTVTTGAANAKTFDLTNFHLSGGSGGQILSATATAGVLAWTAAPPASVLVDPPITGDGLTGTELSLTVATHALATDQVQVGTDNVFPVSSAGLRSQLGAAATLANLHTTTATTVVPAIAELADKITALTGAIILVGGFNATGPNGAIVNATAPAANGALPAASATNRGWYLIVETGGTITGGAAPPGTYAVGDWLLSSGTAWLHFAMNFGAILASNVGITTITGLTGTNVQAALEWLFNNRIGLADIHVDGDSIVGTGASATPFMVDIVDGGTF